jgi:hypothetical protein
MVIRKTRLKWKKKMGLFAIVPDLLRLLQPQPATATSPKRQKQPKPSTPKCNCNSSSITQQKLESVLMIKEIGLFLMSTVVCLMKSKS